MSRFRGYRPDQAYLLPASVRDELGSEHLCFFVRGVIERLDMSVFEQGYSAEGGLLYALQLMLGVWLYAYALGITSAWQVERKLVEDLAFRYLVAGERVDNWALSAFHRRHGRALNDAFTQVLHPSDEDLSLGTPVVPGWDDGGPLALFLRAGREFEGICGARRHSQASGNPELRGEIGGTLICY